MYFRQMAAILHLAVTPISKSIHALKHLHTANSSSEPSVNCLLEVKAANSDVTDNKLSELEKYWKSVKENPSDFTGWTYLLQYVEQENMLEDARVAFNAFFELYPYCYGYWKKYADLEKRHEKVDVTEQVFERGVKAIPLSVDLWVHYIGFSITLSGTSPSSDAYHKVNGCFERAVAAAGMEFRSDKLWETYVGWLKERGNIKKAIEVLDHVLKIPTLQYRHHYETFKDFVNRHHPKDLLSLDEFLTLRKQVVMKTQSSVISQDDDDITDVVATDNDHPPGVDITAIDGGLSGVDLTKSKLEDEIETSLLRQKIIEIRERWHRKNEEEVAKRWSYEEGIRRPYFHVKPLERAQLKNWKEYLDFEIANGTHERVVCLFERCLIACALYEEYWLKFAKYMEDHSVEEARRVYRRACRIHLPRKPTAHLAWAAFEERLGCPTAASEILSELDKSMPGLAMVAVRRIGIERRRGNSEVVASLYQRLIAEADSTEVHSFYTIKYSRYQAKVLGNIGLAKQILEEALAKDSANTKLYLQLLDLEYQQSVINESAMLLLFERAITADLAIEHRLSFSQRRMEFLEDFGSNVARIIDAYDEHQKLMKELQLVRKQRLSTDVTGSKVDDMHSIKRMKPDTPTNTGHPPTSNGETPVTVLHTSNMTSSATTLDAVRAPILQPPPQTYNYTHSWPGYAGAVYDYRQTAAWTTGQSYATPYYGGPSH